LAGAALAAAAGAAAPAAGFGSGRSGGSSSGRLGLSLDLRLTAMNDDNVGSEAGANTFRQLDFTDVDGFVQVQGAHVDRNGLRKILRKAAHFEIVVDGLDQTAKFHASRVADELHGHMGVNFFVVSHRVEVDVKDATLEVVMLHFLHESELVSGTTGDLQGDEDVVRGGAFEELREGLAVHLELRRSGLAAVESSGDVASLAQAVDGTETGGGAGFGVEIEDFGHDFGVSG
jgi:hypothetical protein